MNTQMNVTGQQLIDFLDTEARGRRMNASTASSRRSAVREVLSVAFGQAWRTTPFTARDVDELLEKFVAAHSEDFTPESIQSYRSNFRRTVALVLGEPTLDSSDRWIAHRFPIREGVAVEIRLPADLTTAEARRLATFITALPFDES